MGDLGDEEEFSEEELEGWEEYQEDDNPWEDLDDGLDEDEEKDPSGEPLDEELEKLVSASLFG